MCVLAGALLWPTTGAAQVVNSCELGTYDSALRTNIDGPAGSSRLELRGTNGQPIEIRCGEVQLIAQEIDYLLPEERLIARGQVVFQQTGTRIAAIRGEFDVKTRTGFFEQASGTLQLTGQDESGIFYRLVNAKKI